MIGNYIDIDYTQLKFLKSALDDLGEDKFPIAIRNTMNDMAFAMKGNKSKKGTIQLRGEREFEYNRTKTLYRSLSGVEKAKGKNINNMSSGAGIYQRSGKDETAKGMAKQQDAEPLDQTWTPLQKSRIAKNKARKIRAKAKHKNLNYVDITRFGRGRERMREIAVASMRSSPIVIEGRRGKAYGKRYIAIPVKTFKDSYDENGKNVGRRYNMNFYYRENKDKKVRLTKKVPFVRLAGYDAIRHFDEYFVKNFDWAFKRL